MIVGGGKTDFFLSFVSSVSPSSPSLKAKCPSLDLAAGWLVCFLGSCHCTELAAHREENSVRWPRGARQEGLLASARRPATRTRDCSGGGGAGLHSQRTRSARAGQLAATRTRDCGGGGAGLYWPEREEGRRRKREAGGLRRKKKRNEEKE